MNKNNTSQKADAPAEVRVGEVLQYGDEYRDPHTGEWYPTKSEGRKVGVLNCTNLEYRRPVKYAFSHDHVRSSLQNQEEAA